MPRKKGSQRALEVGQRLSSAETAGTEEEEAVRPGWRQPQAHTGQGGGLAGVRASPSSPTRSPLGAAFADHLQRVSKGRLIGRSQLDNENLKWDVSLSL